MILQILIGMASAEQMVILSKEELSATEQSAIPATAEQIVWADLQQLPLVITNAEIPGKCSGLPKNIEDVEASLAGVVNSLAYIELDKADGHMRRVENDFRCLQEIASPALLSSSYFLSGLTYFYREDTEKTIAAWQQAIVFNPDIIWDDRFEPSGKDLFQTTIDDMQSVAEAQLIIYPSSAKIVIDGEERQSGDSIPAGVHLIQHQQESIRSHWVEVAAGSDVTLISFGDFSGDLHTVMKDDSLRQEFLIALKLLPDGSDFQVVENETLWTLSMSGDSWKSKELNTRSTTIPTETIADSRDKKRHKSLLYASVGAATLSGASLLLAQQQREKFMVEADQRVADDLRAANAASYWSGVGLGVTAGGLMLAGVIKW